MITFTGNGLNVVIVVSDYNFHQDWQTFASWYSINRILPDVEVSISLPKSTSPNLFKWMPKVNVKKYKTLKLPAAIINCGTMAVREICFNLENGISQDGAVTLCVDGLYEKKPISGLCCDCTEHHATTFVQVNKCGYYDKKTWLKQARSPFGMKLNTLDVSVNELAVLKLWGQMYNLYCVVA